VETVLVHELEAFVRTRLGATNALDTFLEQYPGEEAGRNQLNEAFEEAAAQLDAKGIAHKEQMALLLVPADPAAERIRQMAQEAVPQIEMHAAAKGDDLVFYREILDIQLAELPQLGPEAKAAYEMQRGTEHFTPHSRSDITDWRTLGG
jgi:hypothetical protein